MPQDAGVCVPVRTCLCSRWSRSSSWWGQWSAPAHFYSEQVHQHRCGPPTGGGAKHRDIRVLSFYDIYLISIYLLENCWGDAGNVWDRCGMWVGHGRDKWVGHGTDKWVGQLPIHPSVFPSVCLTLLPHGLSFFLSDPLPAKLSVCLSVLPGPTSCLSIYLSIYPSTQPPVHYCISLLIHASVCLSNCPLCLSVYLFINPSIFPSLIHPSVLYIYN